MGWDANNTVEQVATWYYVFNNLCCYCNNELGKPFVYRTLDEFGQEITHEVTEANRLQTDRCHLIDSKVNGGGFAVDNIALGHHSCNQQAELLGLHFALSRFTSTPTTRLNEIKEKAKRARVIVENIAKDEIGKDEAKVLNLAYAMRESYPAFFKMPVNGKNGRMSEARLARINKHALAS